LRNPRGNSSSGLGEVIAAVLAPRGQIYGFRDALHIIWYVLLAAAAVSAVYHLLIT